MAEIPLPVRPKVTKIDRDILRVLDKTTTPSPGSLSATVREIKGQLPRWRSYDAVRHHLQEMATADTPLVARRKSGRNWLYRITYAGIGELGISDE